jgi:hypothetical protein
MIDLSIYGPCPDMPILLDDEKYYLNNEQKTKIDNIWTRINPNTENGKKFNQMIECSKALVESYKERKLNKLG